VTTTALPARFGGLGIINPVQLSSIKYNASTRVTGPLEELLLSYVLLMFGALSSL